MPLSRLWGTNFSRLLLAGRVEKNSVYVDYPRFPSPFSHTYTYRVIQQAPNVAWEAGLGKCTLVMVDPDAPERNTTDGAHPSTKGPWLHWLVTDAVAKCVLGGNGVCVQV